MFSCVVLASVHELRDDSGFGRLWGFVSRYCKLFHYQNIQ